MATRSMPTVEWRPVGEGELELAADAVGRRDEHRVAIGAREQADLVVEAKQAGEPVFPLEHARGEGSPHERWEPGHRVFVGLQVDAGRAIVEGLGHQFVGCQLSVVSCPLSVARCPLSVVSCQLSVVADGLRVAHLYGRTAWTAYGSLPTRERANPPVAQIECGISRAWQTTPINPTRQRRF